MTDNSKYLSYITRGVIGLALGVGVSSLMNESDLFAPTANTDFPELQVAVNRMTNIVTGIVIPMFGVVTLMSIIYYVIKYAISVKEYSTVSKLSNNLDKELEKDVVIEDTVEDVTVEKTAYIKEIKNRIGSLQSRRLLVNKLNRTVSLLKDIESIPTIKEYSLANYMSLFFEVLDSYIKLLSIKNPNEEKMRTATNKTSHAIDSINNALQGLIDKYSDSTELSLSVSSNTLDRVLEKDGLHQDNDSSLSLKI